MTKYNLKNMNGENPMPISLTSFAQNGDLMATTGSTLSNGLFSKMQDEDINENQKFKCECSNKSSNSTVFSITDEHLFHQRLTTVPATKPTLNEWIKQRTKNGCSRKMLNKRVPIFSWLPQYNAHTAVCDLLAGITVGLTIIPQAIAYSNVAGLPAQVGLYSSVLPCFIYAIFGSCKDAAIGPTAISALLSRDNSHEFGIDGAVLLCFLTGCVEFLMGVLQLGFIIDFISGPVSVGFTSAAAIIIATTQVKDILGLSYSGGKFLEVWEQIFEHITESRLWDCLLGLACLIILFLLRKAKDLPVGEENKQNRLKMCCSKSIWLLSTARNIIVVIFSAVIAYLFETNNYHPFVLTGYVKSGLPMFDLPPFSARAGNTTYNFIEMTSTFGSAIVAVPLFGILENIALAKAFSNGRAIDATQEMLALGVCNIASSFVSSMPVTGALSRGAVNNASGVKTTFGGVYTGLIVIASLYLFTPYFFYIPKASLAAVIISAVVFMVELHVLKPIWRSKKSDVIPACATFLACLFLRLEVGIFVGIGLNMVSLLYATARPSVDVDKVQTEFGCEYILITPDRSLVFPSVEYVRSVVSKAGVKHGASSIPVVLDCRHIQGADFTAARGIKSLIEDFVTRNQPIIFCNLKPSVTTTFQGVRPRGFVCCHTGEELNDTLMRYNNDAGPLVNGDIRTSIV